MSRINGAKAQRAATLLSGCIKAMSLYPEAHPSVVQPLRELTSLFSEAGRAHEVVRLGVVDDLLFVGDHLFVNPTTAVEELASVLAGKEIESIEILRGINYDDLRTFAAEMARAAKGGDVAAALATRGVRSIRITAVKEPEGEEPFDPHATYNQALTVIRRVWSDIEKGRIPSSSEVISVVDTMVDMTIQDPSTLLGLAMIKDYDNYTFNHSVNVGVLTLALSSALGLGREELRETGVAGLLHDLGKTRIDKAILNKPGKLSAAETAEMKKHPEIGAHIVEQMGGFSQRVVRGVLGHHLKVTRQGYPEWASREHFDQICDIIAVADSYDAITTLRSYQRPMTPKTAVDTLRRLSGTDLDGALVERFVEMMGDYPVGTLVRLDSGELAVVFRPNPSDSQAPTVKVVSDSWGNLLQEPRVEKLDGEGPKEHPSIIAIVDPVAKNLDVARYLS